MSGANALKAKLYSWLTLAKLRARGAARPPVAGIESHDGTLFVGPANSAGQGHAWAHAAQQYAAQERNSNAAIRGFSMSFTNDSGFAFDIDQRVLSSYAAHSRGWQKRQLAAVSRAQAALLESGVPPFSTLWGGDTLQQLHALQRAGVRVALLFHGSDIRDPDRHIAAEPLSHFRADPDFTRVFRGVTARNRELVRAADVPVFVSTPDLLDEIPGAQWLPVVVDPSKWVQTEAPLAPGRPLRVAHAPSSSTVKGTDLIEPTLHDLHERGVIEYRPVSGVPHHEMPGIYGAADVVIDQFRVGNYGVAACEALAAGRIVVSHVSDRVRDLTRERTGEDLPVLEATPGTLESVLTAIAADPVAYRELASRGPGFVRRHHDGARSGQTLLEWMERSAAPTEESTR
ncbi:glycosyltransferase [Leucobacter salsicius]|uniref:glycosyltransferase n=1 Tax=Leucobacter salsicius TaxID=664638 RepID=UPI00034D07C3|nr:glycosyltransferase [Leucobacter salsicius]